MKRVVIIILALFLVVSFGEAAKKGKNEKEKKKPDIFSGLKFRSIGPAYASGRIADFAVNPKNHSEYYVGVACGHIWKTVNAGVTWKPVFEKYGTYSIGCLAMDPTNSNVVWAGTGENNHQRALAYGNGVYKTMDGGKSWKNMGLKESRHIGKILINPKDSNIVYVAAEGSAWGPGGERGLYKTTDGGKTWKKVLEISEHTGINDMVMHPCNPDLIIASSEQRRRHVHTKIGGGPESTIYKTTDGGKNWRKVTSGLPKVHIGGIGLAISPAKPDVVYAIVEAAEDKSGFYRSTDRGESWNRMSDHNASGQYYNEIVADPKDVDTVYSTETVSRVTRDGGKTFTRLGLNGRHVDDHALWINPCDTAHMRMGGDGGVYESFDGGKEWRHIPNLPVIQFYRVGVDNSFPFYYVYGGTQDNNSMGGPSRNISQDGVTTGEWIVTNGGDGFWTRVDPKNPDIVYAESQYGNMVRYDRKSGEKAYIKPMPRKGEDTYKWNWNTPLLISAHSNTRLYCAANKVFRSDDRGDSWQVISDDLTAKIDRNKWPVMGKYWSADAVAKDVSTSQFGTIVSMDESPANESLLYIGVDDGLMQVTENGGKQWRKIESFPGIPANTYVSDILASKYDENVVFASFDNRKRDDFKPYLLKSLDKGKTWKSIASNLPNNGTVHTIAQDHVKKELLFVGTEFGIFFSHNGGMKWSQLKGGIPPIAVRDIAIQERENDLALATFGRGFYILDDYSALREYSPELEKKEAHLFSTRAALMYIEQSKKYGQGGDQYLAKNPPFGAVFTWFLKDSYKTKKQARRKKEKALFKDGKPIPNPTWDELRLENMEIAPYLLFTITDEAGNVIRELRKKPSKGINRVAWNLRYPSPNPVRVVKNKFNPLAKERDGLLVMPGTYNVSISKVIDGKMTQLVKPQPFTAKVLKNTTLPAKDRKALVAFQRKVAELTRVLQGTFNLTDELLKKTVGIKQTLMVTPGALQKLLPAARGIEKQLNDVQFLLRGHRPKASREEIPPGHMPLRNRLNSIIWGMFNSTSAPTKMQQDTYSIIKEELAPVLVTLKKIAQQDLKNLEQKMEAAGAPWTPGRIPQFTD